MNHSTREAPVYSIVVAGESICETSWLPMAAAAWHRATRDTTSARGADVVLEKDRDPIAHQFAKRGGHSPWPDGPEPGLGDLAAAILLLARTAGANVQDVAAALTAQGLPTSRSRLELIKSNDPSNRSQTSESELIAICYAAVGVLKNFEQ